MRCIKSAHRDKIQNLLSVNYEFQAPTLAKQRIHHHNLTPCEETVFLKQTPVRHNNKTNEPPSATYLLEITEANEP